MNAIPYDNLDLKSKLLLEIKNRKILNTKSQALA